MRGGEFFARPDRIPTRTLVVNLALTANTYPELMVDDTLAPSRFGADRRAARRRMRRWFRVRGFPRPRGLAFITALNVIVWAVILSAAFGGRT
ncbi:MAG: hypothetical protein AAGC56_11205 [Pseudomonadota bacterium]